MATMNISLPEPLKDWVQSQTERGQYANSSDYVRDLIRKDQQQEEKLLAFQKAITEGLESGEPKEFDMDSFKKRMMAEMGHGDL